MSRNVIVACSPGEAGVNAARMLREAGYEVRQLDSPDPLEDMPGQEVRPPELVVVDAAFGPEGGVAVCRKLRENAYWRTVSLMLIVPSGEQRLEECLVSGINDFILDPFPAAELLEKAGRLSVVPARRDLNTLARVRDPRAHASTLLGKTLNLSLNGLLLEIEGPLVVGRLVEVEFFLPDDSDPVRLKGRVIRRAMELDLYHPAFGIRFEEMSERDRARIDDFIARREAAAPSALMDSE